MFKKLLTIIFPAILTILPCCAALIFQELKPGVSRDFEVRDRMGQPTMEWKEADGSVIWEYPRTPNGIVNYMVVIGPDSILREIRQVLTEENFAKVVPGMDKTAVRRLLGKPAEDAFYPLKKEWIWSWKIKEENRSQTFFDVYFDESGQVLRSGRLERAMPG
jgi:hypothetical protein